MKMRTKTLIAIAALTVTIFATLYGIANLVVLRSFTILEEQETREDIMRTTNALFNELSDLDGKASDWAFWDDTYAFVKNLSENYVTLNLADSTFENLRINLMVFVNSSGQIVYSKAFNVTNHMEAPVPQSVKEEVTSHDLIWNHSSTVSKTIGAITLPEASLLIASRPILTSQEEGPIEGALILGRYLDSEEIRFLSQTLGLHLTERTANDPEMPSDFQLAYSKLLDSSQVFVQPLNATSVAGYTLMRDVYGDPAFMLRADGPRDTYQQGLATVNYFMVSSFAICVVFGGTVMMLLETGILAPLSRITTAIKEMGTSRHHTYPMPRLGTDEVSILSQTIKDAVSQRLAAIEELAGMVGHDLRNPLTGIANATYYIRTKYEQAMDTKGKEMLKIIEDDITYSNKIVNDLQEYSRKVRLEPTETNPKSLVKESLSHVTVPEKIQFIDLTANEPKLTVDVNKLKRAFTNLIKNAVDAMPEGGSLTITSRRASENAVFTFSDTGVGISKETLQKLGMPLFTTKSKGMGFGLPISKRLIEAHGGSMSIESTLGKGTTVTVAIPLTTEVNNDNATRTQLPENT